MKKYKLLRDLPGYRAGTIFCENSPYGWRPEKTNDEYTFYMPSAVMLDYNWFQPVNEPLFTYGDMMSFACFFRFSKTEVDFRYKDVEEILEYWMSNVFIKQQDHEKK